MRGVYLKLEEKTIEDLRQIAKAEGMGYTVLIRHWIVNKVREYQRRYRK